MELVNPNIAMSYRGVEIPQRNVLADYAAIQQIQGGRQAQELNALKMQEYERARSEEEGTRNFLRGKDLALPETRAGLAQFGKTGLAYGEALAKQDTAALTQRETLFKVEKAKKDFIAQVQRDTSQNPSDANITAYVEDLAANPLFTAAEKQQMTAGASRLLAMPVEQRRAFMSSQGASAADLKPPAPAAPPSMVAEYTFAKTPDGGGFKGDYQQFVTARAAAGRAPATPSAPVAVMDPVTGKQIYVSREQAISGRMAPAVSAEAKPLNEGQANATAFGLRMKEADSILEDLAKKGVLKGAVVEGVPFVGGALGQALPSALGGTSAAQQQVNQAKSNFITAVLRKESGAVISDSEFDREDKKYFPQINDNPEVIKQKAKARKLAIQAIEVQAGPGAKSIREYDPKAGAGEWKVVK